MKFFRQKPSIFRSQALHSVFLEAKLFVHRRSQSDADARLRTVWQRLDRVVSQGLLRLQMLGCVWSMSTSQPEKQLVSSFAGLQQSVDLELRPLMPYDLSTWQG